MNTLYEEMNTFLANQLVLGMKIHNIHWFMVGEGFFPMHEKMDELYDDAQERIDIVAERLLVIGAKPLGSLQAMLDRTTVKELGTDYIKAVDGVTKLVADTTQLHELAVRIVKIAEANDDVGTADIFTGFAVDLGKTLWMMRAYIR